MQLKTPIIIVNFKTYKEGTGENAENLAKMCEKVANYYKKTIVVAVQEPDIYRVAHAVKIPVFSQHADPIDYGAHTGHTLPEDLKENGAAGCLLNHSEDRFKIDDLEKSIEKAKTVDLITVVCASDIDVATAAAAFRPDFIAVEPPELIGGDISVSTAKPEVITKTVEKVKKVADIPVLCGAGIKTKEDVAKAIQLGAQGILISSGIVKAKDPEQILRELASVL